MVMPMIVIPSIFMLVPAAILTLQQRRDVNDDELVIVRYAEFAARRAWVVVVVEDQQAVVVEHQYVFDGDEREGEHRVRLTVGGYVARIVDVHEIGNFFLDQVAIGIAAAQIDLEDLLEPRRRGEARIAGVALAAVAFDDQELTVAERGEAASRR
jgi:hypothetical protein